VPFLFSHPRARPLLFFLLWVSLAHPLLARRARACPPIRLRAPLSPSRSLLFLTRKNSHPSARTSRPLSPALSRRPRAPSCWPRRLAPLAVVAPSLVDNHRQQASVRLSCPPFF
jgi:hypothetical protein